MFPEPKKLGQQLAYADKRGFSVALIAGENEFAAGKVQLKNLAAQTSTELSTADMPALVSAIRSAIS